MQDLKITLIQSKLHWHEIDANLAMFEEKIWSLRDQPDLILLPEMFTTGFTMESESLAEPANSRTFRWMSQMAKQTETMIVGSYIIKEKGHYFNRVYCVTPDSSATQNLYDKRHLFRMGEENNHYKAGEQKLIVSWKGWKIRPLVCYDLRFPVWSRNQSKDTSLDYDLLLYLANWPTARVSAWDTLLRARAIENLSYCAGINRTGEDGNGSDHNGHSVVIDPKGDQLLSFDSEEDEKTVSLSAKGLKKYREKFPAFLDSDPFKIQM